MSLPRAPFLSFGGGGGGVCVCMCGESPMGAFPVSFKVVEFDDDDNIMNNHTSLFRP